MRKLPAVRISDTPISGLGDARDVSGSPMLSRLFALTGFLLIGAL